MAEKNKKADRHDVLSEYVSIDGKTLQDVVQYFQDKLSEYERVFTGYEKYTLESVPDLYNDGSHLEIWGWREENERERKERLEEEKRRRDFRKQHYLQLKKEFEG